MLRFASVASIATIACACGDDLVAPDPTTDVPTDAETYKLVAAGNLHACAITTDDRLYCWGANGRGELGDGTLVDHASPTVVGASTWISVAAGGGYQACSFSSGRRCGGHTCAIRSDHTLWCWGANAEGQLGDLTTTDRAMPVQVGEQADWSAVSIGAGHSCGIRNNGQLWCWGKNSEGELGDNTMTATISPIPVANAGPWAQVSAGGAHTCAIDSVSRLWCWGLNMGGQLGTGSNLPWARSAPVMVRGNWVAVSTGSDHTFGLTPDHTVSWWGGRPYIPQSPPQLVPTRVGSAMNWSMVSANGAHACAVSAMSELYCWEVSQEPALVSDDVASVVAGTEFSCSLGNDGGVRCFGDNHHGQIGMGKRGSRLAPAGAPGITVDEHRALGNMHCARSGSDQACWGVGFGTVPVGAGAWQHLARTGFGATASSCAIDATGRLYCWGSNARGVLGLGEQVPDQPQPTQVGTATDWTDIELSQPDGLGSLQPDGITHACGIKGGHLMCWGANSMGKVGIAGRFVVDTPVDVGATADWVDVDIANASSCALRSNGALYCWGYSWGSTLSPEGESFDTPTLVDNSVWTSISVGAHHRCGVHDGKLYCWGTDYHGYLGQGRTERGANFPIPVQLGSDTDWVEAAAGDTVTCGVKQDGSLWCTGRTSLDWNGAPDESVNTLIRIGTDTGWSAIEIGVNHICGVRAGKLECWGNNRFGQLGDGTGYIVTPTLVAPRQ
jgi:alpha-tubulin suppressor-like RCC1 family protein